MSSSTKFSLRGKTAIVTGAGSGINFCFAKALVERGCNVVIGDLALRPEAAALCAAHSAPYDPNDPNDPNAWAPRVIFVPTDVTNWAALEALFDAAEAAFPVTFQTDSVTGGIDIVCPGAGVFEPHWSNFWHPPGSTESRDAPHGSQVEGIGHYACLNINLTHPIRCTQLAIARWLNPTPSSDASAEGSVRAAKVSPSNPKRVVHISSVAGQAPGFSHPLYTASKHALNGFIRSLAPLEARLGIRVNGVAPGVIKTPLWTDHPEKLAMLDEAKDEWVTPEDVAEAMVRCLEDESLGGGTVLEVTKDQTRIVDWKMDPGPQGRGAQASNRHVVHEEVFTWLQADGWGRW